MGRTGVAFNIFNQTMAARGWLVFSSNYRGSLSQGKAFQSAVINDTSEGPGRDIMSGIQVLKDRGIVDDERVPISQSYKLYHALKDNKVEVQFIAYPVSGHWPGDPVHARDVRRRWLNWIADHF